MPNTRPTIPILGMAGIKPHVKGKGFVLRLVLKELNATIHNQLGLMTQRTIRLFLIERVATDRLKDIEVIGSVPALRHLGVPFAGKTGPVTGFAKEIDVEFPDRIRTGGIMPARRAITASGKPG